MPESVFRIVVTVGVGLACFAFVAQSFVVLALYRTIRRIQVTTGQLVDRAEPVLEMVGPVLDKVGPVLDRIGPLVDQLDPIVAEVVPAIEKFSLALEKAAPILDNTNQIILDTRPRIAQIAEQSVAMAKTVRAQVDKAGVLFQDAGDRAKVRMEQLDETVGETVEQLGQVGGAVKRAAMVPVREVGGIAAGVSAAVSSLVYGPRRSSVDAATQDEEMFI